MKEEKRIKKELMDELREVKKRLKSLENSEKECKLTDGALRCHNS